MPEIMISYSHDDATLAARIERQLTDAGYKVWRDISSIPGSAEWDIAIQQAIEQPFSGLMRYQPLAKFTQHRKIKALIG